MQSIWQSIYNVLNQSNFGAIFGPRATNGNDYLRGTIFDDKIDGLKGNDEIHGRWGNDKLYGNDGVDKLYGEEGNDFLDGGKGQDLLFGGEGKDTLFGGKDNDAIDGGTGFDTLKLSGYKNQYDIDLLGDGTIRVTDLTANRDGVDMVINTENVLFGNGQALSLLDLALPKLSFVADGAVPADYLVGGTYLPYGSQSTHGNGFTMTISDEGMVLGLATRYRTVDDPVDPTTTVLEYGGRMIHNTYYLNDGNQDPVNGSNSVHLGRASGNTDFFWGDDDTSLTNLLSQGYQVKLSFTSTTGVDVDLHAAFNAASPSDIVWLDDDTLVPFISDDGGNPLAPNSSTFNSSNVAGFYDPNHNFENRVEDIQIAVYTADDVLVMGVHHTVNYVDLV